MKLNRREFSGLALSGAALPRAAFAEGLTPEKAQRAAMFGTSSEFREAMSYIEARGDLDMTAGLLLSLRFSRARAVRIGASLETLTGQNHGTDWFDWMLWQEANPQIVPHESYPALAREMYLSIDSNFDQFLRPEHIVRERARIRLEEVTWGGVLKDGIPSLDNPDLIPAGAAEYLRSDDLVFGVAINGDARAYPLRIMGWHEMFNEVIGGVPLALAYCTLCGSGILFETDVAGHSDPFVFGSSGFLYRSNKLMFDRETHSLWNQFTGAPVQGRDYRMFVSEPALTKADGTFVPIALDQDGAWQVENIGLLDFENATGSCTNGTAATNMTLRGTVPAGDYTGLSFTIGVPFDWNHGDPTVAPSPLNLTAMFWNWRGGYKFIKFETSPVTGDGMNLAAAAHSEGDGAGDAASGWFLHLGSTLCEAASRTDAPAAPCANPNVMQVTFDNFDPASQIVVIDPAPVIASADLTVNTPDTSPGCMSFPNDPDCNSVPPRRGRTTPK